MEADGSKPAVLWVSPTVSTSFGGPTSTTVNGLIAEHRAGLESSLITTTSGDDRELIAPALERLGANGVEVRTFRRTRLLSKAEAWGFSLKLVLWMVFNLKRFDVIHLQYVWCVTSIFGSVLGRAYGIPVVVTPHESLTDYDIDVASRSRIKRRVKLLLRQLYLRTADLFVFMSVLEECDTRSGSVPGTLISHAVQEEVVSRPVTVKDGSEGSLTIGFLGRNIPKKGIHLIIEAIGRNPERDWKLIIAGPPGTAEFRDQIGKLIREQSVEEKVEWAGYLPERGDLFSICDVLAMPSHYEGFGMVAGEAMCNGIPVIVPRRSGVSEIVREFDAGIVMPERTVEELEKALITLDEQPELLEQYSRNGLKAANSRLSFTAYAEATATAYSALLSEGLPPGSTES